LRPRLAARTGTARTRKDDRNCNAGAAAPANARQELIPASCDDEAAVARFFRELDAWRQTQDEIDIWQLLAAADRALAQIDRLSRRVAAGSVS
jgi:hypothetical protein